jgi:hypothetical protein
MKFNRGQVAIFVVVAILIILIMVLLFVFRASLFEIDSVDPEFAPIYELYVGCIEQETRSAIDILGTQGGRIDVGEYVPGSEYAPFSNHLNFMGIPVPYWYYVAGNNVVDEQVPSRGDMEREVSEFLEERINDCDFNIFYAQGFEIELDDNVEVDTRIEDGGVIVNVKSDLVAFKDDRSARKTNYDIDVRSRLGEMYNTARSIYDKEILEGFLEEYSVDTLRLHAPVDGVEIQCEPEVWKTREVVSDLHSGLEANIAAIKFKGGYYELDSEDDKYFVVDHEIPDGLGVNLMYSRDWPSKVEIFGEGVGQELIVAEPIGNQEGMGILGFCYVPYHYVYDVSFPVMVQLSDNLEIFQFPVAVIIDNNFPKEAQLFSSIYDDSVLEHDVCDFKEGRVQVQTFDVNLNPVEADVSYRCFDRACDLGRTEMAGGNAVLNAEIPICVNGQLIARAEGYADAERLFSSNDERFGEIILEREYEINVRLLMGGRELETGENAIVHFASEDGGSRSVLLPDGEAIILKEGMYDVDVFVYGNSNIVIPSSRKVECFEVAEGGLFGFFGGTKEECVDIEIPEVKIDSALVGGGKTSTYILESELVKKMVEIEVSELARPGSLEQLQYNFEVFNKLGVDLMFG